MIGRGSKEEVIQRLLLTKQRANILEIRLLLQGKEDDAEKVAKKSKALTRQIDLLLGQVMEDWLGQSKTVINDLRLTNAALQRAITNIKKGVQKAENIVKAVGLIDDVIGIGKSLLGI